MPKVHDLYTILLIGALSLLFTAAAGANTVNEEAVEYPESIPDVTRVNAEGLIEAITQYEDMLLIDARVTMDRKQGYIEGSISLPDTETDCNSLEVIIPKFDVPVLFYCNGPKCGRSVKSINKAKACGYTNLYWYRGGFEEWTDKGYPFLKE